VLTISVAATQLGCTPRMLRYRERLGLLPAARHGAGEHRRYGEPQLRAAAAAAAVEKAAGVGPAELAFAVRVLADPALATAVREVARQAGRLPAEPIAALDFDSDKARRLLIRPVPRRP
jgi:hypothetical protein